MADLSWIEAIQKVLAESNSALDYNEISNIIATTGLRTNLGFTPARTVNSYITNDINRNGNSSLFIRTDRGCYTLRTKGEIIISQEIIKEEENKTKTIITSFGMYWDESRINWTGNNPDLFGKQKNAIDTINFKKQIGIYLLHDMMGTLYVGQSFDRPISVRLKEHKSDRLAGRWQKFSWFGLYRIDDRGNIIESLNEQEPLNYRILIDTFEAILIESMEPRQNRKRGNNLEDFEYLQDGSR
jgi:hypothetical protein